MNFRDVRTLAVDALPSFLRPLAEQAAEKERADNEQRRSALAKEIQTAKATHTKTWRTLVDAFDRALAKRDGAWAEYKAAQTGFDMALGARNGESLGHDSYINGRLAEIKTLADPRIEACRAELAALAVAMRNREADTQVMATREVPAAGRNSVRTFQKVTRVRTNAPALQRRVTAIAEAIREAERLSMATDVDVGKAIAKIRASIPEIGDLETMDLKDGAFVAASPTGDDSAGAAPPPYVAQDAPGLGPSTGRGPDDFVVRG